MNSEITWQEYRPLHAATNAPGITWAEFRERYLAANSPSTTYTFVAAETLFRRLCQPDKLADVSETTFDLFAEKLLTNGMSPDGARRRVTNLRLGLKWGFDAGLVDPANFLVEKSRGGKWQWKPSRQWHGDDAGKACA